MGLKGSNWAYSGLKGTKWVFIGSKSVKNGSCGVLGGLKESKSGGGEGCGG